MIKVGSKVMKKHSHDGTDQAGQPTGRVLTVTSIETHNPVDGPSNDLIANLSDNNLEFIHNLFEVTPKLYRAVVNHYRRGGR